MQLNIKVLGAAELAKAMDRAASQVPFAAARAINVVLTEARGKVQADMRRVFDRPTPWVINSLRIKHATKATMAGELAFKDINSVTSSRTMVFPHVDGGRRHRKAMEARLFAAGLLPAGYSVVPGGGAKLDAFGNISRGQVSQLLNVLGTYTEAGYNKANDKTRQRLAKGNAKKNVYGFEWWVNPVNGPAKHIPPGVYQRVRTGFGSSLKPVLVFVREARYRPRMGFEDTVQAWAVKRFPAEFEREFDAAVRTAILKRQGVLL